MFLLSRWEKIFFSSLFVLVTIGWDARPAEAAGLSISPTVSSLRVGQTVTLTVRVDSADKTLNAVSGSLSFPVNLLEVVSVSKNNSILTYWVDEPVFNNVTGSWRFEGLVPNPGWSGFSGQVASVVFRAKAAGRAIVKFDSATVLANDGLGTNILQGLSSAEVAITTAGMQTPRSTSPTTGGPAPVVSSPTHPDSHRWYANNRPSFEWDLPAGVTGVNFLADRFANSNPGASSDGLLGNYTYGQVSDGRWYFHLRLRDASGWSDISHFGFNVDVTKPSALTINLIPRLDLTMPTAKLELAAVDKDSGLERFEIAVDGTLVATVAATSSPVEYELTSLKPGEHIIAVRVFDQAGNELADSVNLLVVALDPPIITDYPRRLMAGEPLKIGGQTYPDSEVIISYDVSSVAGSPIIQHVFSDGLGRFQVVLVDKPASGLYRIVARVRDRRGAESLGGIPVEVMVIEPSWWRWGTTGIKILSVVVPLVALGGGLLYLFYYIWAKVARLKRRVRRESHEAEQALHGAFDLLRDQVGEQVVRLQALRSKRELTPEEKKFLTDLRQSFNDAEKYVRREIIDIEKQVD
ncbi:MAG: cohesin domain-containing protein [Patescibacteria group bacterium]